MPSSASAMTCASTCRRPRCSAGDRPRQGLELVVGQVLDRPGGTAESPHLVRVGPVAFEAERDLVQRIEWLQRSSFVRSVPSWPGSERPVAARRASWGTAAAMARPATRPPCPARPWRAAVRSTGALSRCPPTGRRAGHQLGHGADGQLVGHDRLDLVPRERRGHLPPDPGPGEPGAEDGLVRRVLVEVDEDACAAFLLPPLGGDLVGVAALQLTGESDGGGPHGERVPARLEPDVDVQPVAARRLRVAAQAELVEQVLALQRGGPDLVEADALGRIEVDAELVGMVRVGRQIRPQVQPETAEVDRPHDVGDVGDDQGVGRGAVGGRDDGRLQPLRSAGRDPLLEEGLASGPSGNRWRSAGRPPAVFSRCSPMSR